MNNQKLINLKSDEAVVTFAMLAVSLVGPQNTYIISNPLSYSPKLAENKMLVIIGLDGNDTGGIERMSRIVDDVRTPPVLAVETHLLQTIRDAISTNRGAK